MTDKEKESLEYAKMCFSGILQDIIRLSNSADILNDIQDKKLNNLVRRMAEIRLKCGIAIDHLNHIKALNERETEREEKARFTKSQSSKSSSEGDKLG